MSWNGLGAMPIIVGALPGWRLTQHNGQGLDHSTVTFWSTLLVYDHHIMEDNFRILWSRKSHNLPLQIFKGNNLQLFKP